jgi:hypothetical protein
MTSPNSNPEPGFSAHRSIDDQSDANQDVNPLSGLIGTLSDLHVVKMQQRQKEGGEIPTMPAPELNADVIELNRSKNGDPQPPSPQPETFATTKKSKSHPYTNLVEQFRANPQQGQRSAQTNQSGLEQAVELESAALETAKIEPAQANPFALDPPDKFPGNLEDLDPLGNGDLPEIRYQPDYGDDRSNEELGAYSNDRGIEPIDLTANSAFDSTDEVGGLDALRQDLDLESSQVGFDQSNAQTQDQLTDQLSNELDDLLNGLSGLGIGLSDQESAQIDPEPGDRAPHLDADGSNNPKQPNTNARPTSKAPQLLNQDGEPVDLLRDLLGSAAEDEVSQIEQKLALITQKVEQLDYQINTPPDTSQIDGQFANIGGQLAEIDGQFANLENQLESRLATLQNTIQNHPKIIELDTRLGDLQTSGGRSL